MANNMELQMVIKAQDRASKDIKKVQKQMKGITKEMKTQQKTAKKGGSIFSKAFAMKAIAVGALYKGVKSVTEAFIKQERAEKRLETLAMNVTGTTKEQIEGLKEQAKALQKVTTIGDEVTMVGQSQLATFQLQTKTIKKLTPSLLDMATAVYGVNVTQEQMIMVSNLAGKAMMGQTGALSRYGITLDETQRKLLQQGDEMERASAMAEILKQNFGGLAGEMKNTLEGQIVSVKNQFGDMKEMVGEKLMPVLLDGLTWLSETGLPAVESAGATLASAWNTNFLGIKSITLTVIKIIKLAIDGWITAIELAIDAWGRAVKAYEAMKRAIGRGGIQTPGIANPVGAGDVVGGSSPKVKSAFGGYTMPNQPRIVGERGQEVFVPNSAGRIIPNDKLGNSGVNININVDASGNSDANSIAGAIKLEIENLARSMQLKTLGVPSNI